MRSLLLAFLLGAPAAAATNTQIDGSWQIKTHSVGDYATAVTTGAVAGVFPIEKGGNGTQTGISTAAAAQFNALAASTTTASSVKASTGTCALPLVAYTLNSGNLVCIQPSNVTGNAATVTTNANLTGNVTSVGNATTIAVIPAVSGAALTSLTGANVTGTVPAATNATNLLVGTIGQIPYQSGTAATTFLPAMASGGIITGNGTGAVPSTGTFAGTSNQITVTRTGSNIVLSTPQNINSGATPTFTATNFSGVSAITGLGTQAQALNLGSHLINSVTDPASAQDAATKNYVDTNVPKVLPNKLSCRLGTTAALPSNSYANGSSGVGATITGLGLGLLTVDGVTPAVGDRVMVNNEGTASHNGLYTMTTNAAGVFFVLTRATDFDTITEMGAGTAFFVDSGTVNTDAFFALIASVTTVGTDPINFTQVNGLAGVTAGTGLSKSGNTISLVLPVSTATTANGVTDIIQASGNTGSSYTVDWSKGLVSSMTLTAATVTLSFSNTTAGQTMTLEITQDSSGSRVITWPTSPATIKWGTTGAPTLTTTANKTDLVTFFWDGTSLFGLTGGQGF